MRYNFSLRTMSMEIFKMKVYLYKYKHIYLSLNLQVSLNYLYSWFLNDVETTVLLNTASPDAVCTPQMPATTPRHLAIAKASSARQKRWESEQASGLSNVTISYLQHVGAHWQRGSHVVHCFRGSTSSTPEHRLPCCLETSLICCCWGLSLLLSVRMIM